MATAVISQLAGNFATPPAIAKRLYTYPGAVTPTRRFEASQLARSIGDAVSSLPDLTGGMTLSQAGASSLWPTLERVSNAWGLKFDGVDDIMGTGTNSFTDTVFSIVLVARLNASTVTGKTALNPNGFQIGTDSSGWKVTGSTTIKPASQPALDAGWHFIGFVRNGASSIMRFDSTVVTGDPGTPTASNQIATSPSCAQSLSHLSVFSGTALTDAQLQAIRTGFKGGQYPGLP